MIFIVPNETKENSLLTFLNTLMKMHVTILTWLAPKASRSLLNIFDFKNLECLLFSYTLDSTKVQRFNIRILHIHIGLIINTGILCKAIAYYVSLL